MTPKLKNPINKNSQIKKNVLKNTTTTATTKVCKPILNDEVKLTDFKHMVEHGTEFEPQVTMDDKVKIQVLKSIAINMAKPVKIPFVRLEHIDAHQLMVISNNPDVFKKISYQNYSEWMSRIKKSSTPKK